ncbi:MAG: hypothetical protein DRP00_02165 [Candidatus Aenigmatarchaeota archaeon]|nr:MAG: hypothetical protein DRP00_02165 [Candidatus Aenigmarchaeota archaeon]
MGYSSNPRAIEEEIERLRNFLRENRDLTFEEEGILLDRIEELKKDLEYAKQIKRKRKPIYSPFVLEMKIKHSR